LPLFILLSSVVGKAMPFNISNILSCQTAICMTMFEPPILPTSCSSGIWKRCFLRRRSRVQLEILAWKHRASQSEIIVKVIDQQAKTSHISVMVLLAVLGGLPWRKTSKQTPSKILPMKRSVCTLSNIILLTSRMSSRICRDLS